MGVALKLYGPKRACHADGSVSEVKGWSRFTISWEGVQETCNNGKEVFLECVHGSFNGVALVNV